MWETGNDHDADAAHAVADVKMMPPSPNPNSRIFHVTVALLKMKWRLTRVTDLVSFAKPLTLNPEPTPWTLYPKPLNLQTLNPETPKP